MSFEQDHNRKAIYLLPNLFTMAALFAGFYAIIAATQGRYERAAAAIFIAMFMDGLDGRVARMTNTQSEFGAQLDSLADMVSFGLAPALIMYEWALGSMREFGWHWSKLGWLAAFIYVAAAALRLARFNTQLGSADKRFFQGLASPASAAMMVGLIWLGTDLGYTGRELVIPAMVITLLCSTLMVSRFAYYSFKNLGGRVPFTAMLLVVLVFVSVSFDPAKVLFIFFFAYMMSGPAIALLRWIRKRHRFQS
ncbi:MAG TPA: CDP-diacylglycerol--serine O-phosphatidyltransferase [Gammaproteobacteria bacterium]